MVEEWASVRPAECVKVDTGDLGEGWLRWGGRLPPAVCTTSRIVSPPGHWLSVTVVPSQKSRGWPAIR